MNKDKLVRGFILSTMIGLYVIVSLISTLHVIEFFKMSNPHWLAVSLAIAFEIGAAASLASIIILDKTSKALVWSLFILLTAMQMQGNMFYAYNNLENYQSWIELFGLQEEELITQKRMLSFVSGAILPLIALGFIKSLVDYIRPDDLTKEPNKGLSIEEPTEQPNLAEILVNPIEAVKPQPVTEPELVTEDPKVGNLTVEPMVSPPFKKYVSKP